MVPRLGSSLLLAAALFTVATACAQSTSQDRNLDAARATYYTPTAQGLRSFHCQLNVDWKDLLSRSSGTDVKDDNPFLQYLQSAHLYVADDLNGQGRLDWENTRVPPLGKEDAAADMKQGMQQVLNGFFTSWNEYMNGNMVPALDANTTLTQDATGLHLHTRTDTTEINENFDRNLLLTDTHIIMPSVDATAYPTYSDTPDGRVISVIRTVLRQPATAPPNELTVAITYAPVARFRLPQTIRYEIKNVGSFLFNLSGCTVQSTEETAAKL